VDTPSGSLGTILVVDDDVQVRALAARALAQEGFDVLQAPDANSALELLGEPLGHQVCLVITDIVMPGMQGHELGRILHGQRPTLPVLYMSGHSRPTSPSFLPPICITAGLRKRLWATERKHLPVKDVAAAGGWKDVTTLLECYQQPDADTLRQVVEYERPVSRPPTAASGRA
jgi:CheY-like chemotaxis protein